MADVEIRVRFGNEVYFAIFCFIISWRARVRHVGPEHGHGGGLAWNLALRRLAVSVRYPPGYFRRANKWARQAFWMLLGAGPKPPMLFVCEIPSTPFQITKNIQTLGFPCPSNPKTPSLPAFRTLPARAADASAGCDAAGSRTWQPCRAGTPPAPQ